MNTEIQDELVLDGIPLQRSETDRSMIYTTFDKLEVAANEDPSA